MGSSRSGPLRWVLVLTAGYAVSLLIVLGGLLDRFAADGSIARGEAALSITLYWALACAALYLPRLWTSHRSQMALALGSIAVSLLVLEAMMRIVGLPAGMRPLLGIRSRTLHHVYPANVEMYEGTYEGTPVFVHTNEDGLRTSYSRDAFRRFATRIAVLGDSFAFGFGVRQEDAFPVQMQEILRDEFGRDDIAVLNAGIISASPFLEKLLFSDIVAHYDPTLVLLLLDPTDIGDDYKYASEAVDEGGRTAFPLPDPECGEQTELRYYGAVVQLTRPLMDALTATLLYPLRAIGRKLRLKGECDYDYYDFELSIGDTVETNRFFIYRHPLELTLPYFEATLDNIESVASAAHEQGAEFVLIVSPRFHHWNPDESPENWESEQYALDEPYQFEYFRFFEQARARVPFPIYDLLPAFRSSEESPLVFREDPHWNARGNAFVARSVAQHLIEQGLVVRARTGSHTGGDAAGAIPPGTD